MGSHSEENGDQDHDRRSELGSEHEKPQAKNLKRSDLDTETLIRHKRNKERDQKRKDHRGFSFTASEKSDPDEERPCRTHRNASGAVDEQTGSEKMKEGRCHIVSPRMS